MKMMNNFKMMALALCCLGMAAFTACDNGNDNDYTLSFDPDQVEITAGATEEVTVSGGVEPYTVTTSNSEAATVTVADNKITITGAGEGSATITVTDKNKISGTISVTVDAAPSLNFDKDEVEVAAGESDTVTVEDGTAPYTVSSEDEDVATATVEGGTITIQGVAAGTTTITVTDDDEISGTISVVVE